MLWHQVPEQSEGLRNNKTVCDRLIMASKDIKSKALVPVNVTSLGKKGTCRCHWVKDFEMERLF